MQLISQSSVRLLAIAILASALTLIGVSATEAQQTGARPSIEGQVTFLYYKDLDAASRFYETILGLEKTYDVGWVRIYQSTPGAFVGLVDETRGAHRAAEEKPVMVSIVTNEIDAWYERMVASGAPILSELSLSTNVPVRAFMVEDPEGYTVEFFQWMEGGG